MRPSPIFLSPHLAIGVLALCACAGDGPAYDSGPMPPEAAPPSATATVTASSGTDGYGGGTGFVFAPAGVLVLLDGTVTWSNFTGVEHNVTIGGVSYPLANGGQYARSFPTVGSFSYACSIHPEMTGSVHVVSP